MDTVLKTTPQEFRREMELIKYANSDDLELVHVKMDDLMCRVLDELGYGEGVNVFEQTTKYYA